MGRDVTEKFTIMKQVHDGVTRFTVSGYLNELSQARLLPFMTPDTATVEIDASGITGVNSVGVAFWVHFAKALSARAKVSYVRMSSNLALHFDMVPSLRVKGAVIDSFHVAELCTACDVAHEVLLERGKHFGAGRTLEIPETACPKCSRPMRTIEEQLDFSWLAKA